MTRPPRRRLPNRAARRADILRALADAAKDLVCDGETFADLSVERLSRQAGISRASFYLYFEDKGELFLGWHDLVDESAQEIVEKWWHAAGWVDPDIDADTTAAWLTAMVDRVMQLVAPTADDDSDLYLTGADIIWQ